MGMMVLSSSPITNRVFLVVVVSRDWSGGEEREKEKKRTEVWKRQKVEHSSLPTFPRYTQTIYDRVTFLIMAAYRHT